MTMLSTSIYLKKSSQRCVNHTLFYSSRSSKIGAQESLKNLTDRSFVLVLRKKEKKAEFWPSLTKEKLKVSWLKTDFSKWVDEDEQDEKAAADEDLEGMGGMGGMPGMGGMGGMPGMGGMGGMPGMGGMGGLPGMGGMGGMDFEQVRKYELY